MEYDSSSLVSYFGPVHKIELNPLSAELEHD